MPYTRQVRDADTNTQRLLADLELHDACAYAAGHAERGEYPLCRYMILLADRACDLLMPDLPLAEVRYLHGDTPPSTRLLPPYLTVDGCDWFWPYALEAVHEALLGLEPNEDDLEITLEDAQAAIAAQEERVARWRELEAALRD